MTLEPSSTAPRLDVRRAAPADRRPVARMLELYQHDLSDIWPQDLDLHGEYGWPIDRYWRQPGHAAFVFLVDDRYAGLALVDDDVCLPGNQRWMAQFFVLKKYRRCAVGARAACAVFDCMPGRWEVGQMAANRPALAFWRRVIGDYTQGRYVEHELHDQRWDGWLQCFDNAAAA